MEISRHIAPPESITQRWLHHGCLDVFWVSSPAYQIQTEIDGPSGLMKLVHGRMGRGRVQQGLGESQLEPGSLAYLDLDQPFQMVHEAGQQLIVRMPKDYLKRRHPEAAWSWGSALGPGPEAEAVRGLAGVLGQGQKELGDASAAGVLRLLVEALGLCRPPVFTAEQGRVQQAQCLVRAHLLEPYLSASWVAEQLRVSRRTMDSSFAEVLALSLSEYIRLQRLQAAAEELRDKKSLNISEIGHRYGFSDASHFSRWFRRRFQMSPGEYRRQAGEERSKLGH